MHMKNCCSRCSTGTISRFLQVRRSADGGGSQTLRLDSDRVVRDPLAETMPIDLKKRELR